MPRGDEIAGPLAVDVTQRFSSGSLASSACASIEYHAARGFGGGGFHLTLRDGLRDALDPWLNELMKS